MTYRPTVHTVLRADCGELFHRRDIQLIASFLDNNSFHWIIKKLPRIINKPKTYILNHLKLHHMQMQSFTLELDRCIYLLEAENEAACSRQCMGLSLDTSVLRKQFPE